MDIIGLFFAVILRNYVLGTLVNDVESHYRKNGDLYFILVPIELNYVKLE